MINIAPYKWWIHMWRSRNYYGIFRNKNHIMPGRWGFYILGFEFGSRKPGNKIGVFLKRIGLWPW